ncbi:phage antirepressor KilAC domain-containing protein [Agitococcus lubricus]|uniref:Regulatory protein Rha n=1 Tax=Agitococcus lubricus TaxID=1077255 RepID=A0A2T5ITC5_9GAMM|nr:phage antirepressor KilAC domain-containing protein [Agitococcus lubricus]PTQ87106.1 regulatory protein Rha [Agitococcus lubricus]
MMNLAKQQTQIKTMSSKQIADVVGSRHDHVKRSIERLAEKGVIQLPPLEEVKNHLGQTVQEYQVNERDSYVVVAQLCPEYTAKLVDWWMATKNQQPVVALPTTYLDALKALVQTEEEKQLAITQVANLENQVNQLTPKAKALDVIANSFGQKTITNVAKVLGVQPEKFLRPWMLKHHWIYLGRDGQYHAHAARIKDGHLVEKTRPIPRTSGITELKVTVYVTAQGETLLARRLAGEAA